VTKSCRKLKTVGLTNGFRVVFPVAGVITHLSACPGRGRPSASPHVPCRSVWFVKNSRLRDGWILGGQWPGRLRTDKQTGDRQTDGEDMDKTLRIRCWLAPQIHSQSVRDYDVHASINLFWCDPHDHHQSDLNPSS